MHLVAALSRASTKWAQLQCMFLEGLEACLPASPRLEWSLQGAHVEPTSSPRRVRVKSTSKPQTSCAMPPGVVHDDSDHGGRAAGRLECLPGPPARNRKSCMRGCEPPREHTSDWARQRKNPAVHVFGPQGISTGIELTSSDV
ncbi:hypothetical protein E5D57_007750 [Metarhizium anisopliae]|nr:hypothetical protein E5D57_007750 [Metarhizium anisopliae]